MNSIKKKIAIIGGGTAGALTAFTLSKIEDFEVDLYLDPNIKPQSVGEGANMLLARELANSVYFDNKKLIEKIGGTKKFGVKKIDFNGSGNYMSDFEFGSYSLHFDSNKLRDYILNDFPLINVIEKNINSFEDIDADFKWDCSGFSEITEDKFNLMSGISVNSSYITQCFWDSPKFEHTKTVAMEHGWVFMVPLQNRCSVGYLYNSNISMENEIKQDVKKIFERYKLNPSTKTTSIAFKNFYRKNNFTINKAYNGNSSFFAEPMEASTIGNIIQTTRLSIPLIYNPKLLDQANEIYLKNQKETELMIAFNYLMGSKYDSKFWKFAKNNSENFLVENLKEEYINKILKFYKDTEANKFTHQFDKFEIGTWGSYSWYKNIKELNAFEKLKNLK